MDDLIMIEHLARKICSLRAIQPDDHHADFGTQWQAVAREAKGVLVAMLEPKGQMTAAGSLAGDVDEPRASRIHTAMIDAAIARQI
jgi:hypothetical protein